MTRILAILLLTFSLNAQVVLQSPVVLNSPVALSQFDFSSSPTNIVSGMTLWLEAGYVPNSDGSQLSVWSDASGNGSNATQSTNSCQPTIRYGQLPNGQRSVRFDGTDDMMLLPGGTVIGKTWTNWTVSYVARSSNLTHNNTVFDSTESTSFESVLSRHIILYASLSLTSQVRDEASHLNTASTPNDLLEWKIVTSTRHGDIVKIRLNGIWLSTNSTSTIGAMDAGSYYATLGAVHNGSGSPVASYLQGEIYGICVNTNELSEAQIVSLENYWSFRTGIPIVDFIPYQSTPVIAFSAVGNPDAGRMLTPSIVGDGSAYKMFYSANYTNAPADINRGWNVLLATSSDGITWAKSGVVLSNAWECSVIKPTNTFFMAHELNSDWGVYLSSSANGTNWTSHGKMVSKAQSTWSSSSAEGPREPCLLLDSGTWYIYYSDIANSDSAYKIGVSTCVGDPTVSGNWNCQATPTFAPSTASPKWNNGSGTESPSIRRFDWLAYPYVMLFTGYSASMVSASYKPWRPAIAYSGSPLGPWIEANNPVLSVGVNGTWNDWIAAEVSQLIVGANMYIYVSCGKTNALNQIGLFTMATNDFKKYIK
jgi:hypothetical protein